MGGRFLFPLLLYGGVLLKTLLLGKLCRLGLVKRYRILSIYLGFSLFRTVASVYLLRTRRPLFGFDGYALFYWVTEPLLWAFYFLLALELYSLMLEGFSGIRRLGRLVMFSALAGVTLACGALMVWDHQAGFFNDALLASLILQERSVFLILSVLMTVLVLLVSYFRLPVARNLLVLCASFGGYFILNASLLILWHYLGDQFILWRNVLNGLFFFGAMAGAAVFLSKAGEVRARSIPAIWAEQNPELETALLSQLQGFNQVLAEVLKR